MSNWGNIYVRWQKIEEAQGHKIREALPDLRSFASCTDTHGQFGTPSVTDEWGLPGADAPILKAYSVYQRREDFREGQDYPERISTEYFIGIITEVRDEQQNIG